VLSKSLIISLSPSIGVARASLISAVTLLLGPTCLNSEARSRLIVFLALGFTGLATGYRVYDDGDFDYYPNNYAEWWSSTYFNANAVWYQTSRYDYHSWVFSVENKKYGHSIRCVSDETLIEAW